MNLTRLISIVCIIILIGCELVFASLPKGITIQKDFQPGFGLSVGSVFIIDGKGVVVHDDQHIGYEIFKGMKLYQKDTIYSFNPGRILLNMLDGTQMTVGSDSQLTINQVNVLPQKSSRRSFINMQRGKARFNVRKLSQFRKTDFKVKTQTALIGVRGSDFLISADQSTTSVTTFDHTKLEVIGLAQPQLPPTILQDFQRVNIESGERPSDIEIISQDEIQNLKTQYKFSSPPKEDDKGIEKEQPKQDSSQSTKKVEKSPKVSDHNKPGDIETDKIKTVESSDHSSKSNDQRAPDEITNTEIFQTETAWVPTQQIVPPSKLIQAPEMNEIPETIVSESIIIKQEEIIDEQSRKKTEVIQEESKALPSFPEIPVHH